MKQSAIQAGCSTRPLAARAEQSQAVPLVEDTRLRRQALRAMLLVLALASAAAAQEPGRIDDSELAALAAEAHAACSPPGGAPSQDRLRLLTGARVLAGLEPRFQVYCARHPALALRIARAVAERPSPEAARAWQVLAELAERGIGTAADPMLAQEHLRRAWAIGARHVVASPPFASLAERDRYLARADTIAFLRRYAAVREMPFARLRLAQALLARGGDADRAEALALVAEAELAYDHEAELIRARVWLAAADPAVRQRALASLRNLSHHPQNGGEARTLLVSLARRALASASSEDRREAIRSLAAAAIGGGNEARADLLLAVTAANGGLPPATVAGEIETLARILQPMLSDDDYPAAARRNQEGGVIRLRGLIDPGGRLVYTEPATAGQSQLLVGALRRLLARRSIRSFDLGAARPPYVWVELPPVTFTPESRLRGTVRLPFSPPQR